MSQRLHNGFRRFGFLGGGITLIGLAALAASCGGSGGSDGGTPATQTSINSSSARAAAADATAFVPICSNTGATATGQPGARLLVTALDLLQQRHQARLAARPVTGGKRALALSGTQPPDVLGTCIGRGGRYGYSSYSHSSGVTTATLTFSNYCTVDSATGQEEVLNGSMTFVNTATPTDSGPISTKFTGDSTGITALVRTPAGSTVSSETLAFSGLVYDVGVPGGSPTAASPDRMVVAEVSQTNAVTGKLRRQTNFAMSSFDTPSGGSQMTYTTRGYRSNGEYFDLSTTTPVTTDAEGDYTGGAFTFTGSAGSSAVLTLVPGATLQATLTVNGTLDSTLPACSI